jgi:hypothetical protein
VKIIYAVKNLGFWYPVPFMLNLLLLISGSSSIQVQDERTGTVHLVGYHYINSARSLNVQWAMLLLLLLSTLLLSLVCWNQYRIATVKINI